MSDPTTTTPKYSQETLEWVMALVKSKKISQFAASQAFGIPQSTLSDKILGKTPVVKKRKKVLSEDKEEKSIMSDPTTATPKYTQETLERVVALIKSKAISQLAASQAFGIPQSTLSDKILGKTSMAKKRKTVLSEKKKQKLVMSHPTTTTPKYTQETLERAVELIKSKTMSQLGASRAFGIPQSTLNDKILGKTPIVKTFSRTVLSEEEEERLASWINVMVRRGFDPTKEDIKDMVKSILDKMGASTVFKDNRPGKDWMANFLSRHKDVSERMPQALGKERSMVSVASLQQWYEELKAYVDTVDSTLLDQPHRIFHVDESGFSICPKTKKVLDPVEAQHVYQPTSSSGTQITVLACSSAAGQYLPPLLIFPYQRDPRFNPLEGFERAFFQKTKNGWISTEDFLTWIRVVFIPAVEDMPKPVLLYVNGPTSHVTSVEIFELCREKGVLLYCLRPHSSHITQPLGQAYFDALKRAWSKAVRKHMLATGEFVTLPTFARVLSKAWKVAARPEIAFSSFDRAGLFPFDPSIVGELKVADSFVPPSTDQPVSSPNTCGPAPESTEATPESPFFKKLKVFEELVRMGSETNLRNSERMCGEKHDLVDTDFSRWRDLLLAMFGVSTSSTSDPLEPTSPVLQIFEPLTSQVEPLPSTLSLRPTTPLTVEPVPSTSRIEPTPPSVNVFG